MMIIRSITMPLALLDEVRLQAARERKSVSKLIRDALRMYLEQLEGKDNADSD